MTVATAYRVTARNTDSGTVNAIHADEGAQAHGYRSALVPGGTVLAYLCHPVLMTWGHDWIHHGTVTVRWRRPTYVGDELDIRAEETSGVFALQARRQGEDLAVAEGAAGLTSDPPPICDPDGADDPVRLASGESLAVGLSFAPWDLTITGEDARSYLDGVTETAPILRVEQVVHPAHLQKLASHVLFRNVTFDTSFQVAASAESEHFAGVPWGTAVRVFCRVTDEWQDQGHSWVATEVEVRGTDGQPYALMRRKSIYRLATGRRQ